MIVIRARLEARAVSPDGRVKQRVTGHNTITRQGAEQFIKMLLCYPSGTKPTPKYMSLVNNSGFSAFDVADTAASTPGWNETTSYSSGGLRKSMSAPIVEPIPASGLACHEIEFVMTQIKTVKGIFIVMDTTTSSLDARAKGSTGGFLSATAPFSAIVPLEIGDSLFVTYKLKGGP